MSDLIINEIKIGPGENRVVNLNEYYLPTGALMEIPTYVYRSKKEGPVILFMAGMHGEEVNGIEIMRNLIRAHHFENLLRGSVIIIPIVNVTSFIHKQRELPDGRDLNRCFPGSPRGSMGSRIAYDLMTQIVRQIDFGFDFHTGGAEINNYPQIRCDFRDKKGFALAQIFAAPFIVNSQSREKSLRKEAHDRGKPILVYEAGESNRLNKLGIDEGLFGCLRILKHYRMIRQEETIIPRPKTILLKRDIWVRAKMSGLFRTSKKYGTFIEKDWVMGYTCDPYGKVQSELTAAENCFLIGLNNQPVVNEGDAILHLGME
ncbi:MAG: succinylglutamate desuccinylase/aspartoacylase family protein [Bacteroidetes bacterium]|nr:succinylglutamate desuccinylase/aspartoacylase family protein [Bacteroidota bacterium]